MQPGLLQYPVSFANPTHNFRQIEQALQGQQFDLLVLPELFAIGYFHPDRAALQASAECAREGASVQFLLQLSADKQATLVGSIAEREGDRLYNSAIVVSRGRWLGKQRKCHLPAIEKRLFSAGEGFTTFDDGQCRFGVLTCFDLWMPEAARLLVQQGAELLCAPANYGGPWTTEMVRIRALENATPLICCNRTGMERWQQEEIHFCGQSQVIDGLGQVVSCAQQETQADFADLHTLQEACSQHPLSQELRKERGRYHIKGPDKAGDVV
ncbi:MAG: carbon-nitrogen hydrolase family protein [Enterobacteriaceae bacterium]